MDQRTLKIIQDNKRRLTINVASKSSTLILQNHTGDEQQEGTGKYIRVGTRTMQENWKHKKNWRERVQRAIRLSVRKDASLSMD